MGTGWIEATCLSDRFFEAPKFLREDLPLHITRQEQQVPTRIRMREGKRDNAKMIHSKNIDEGVIA